MLRLKKLVSTAAAVSALATAALAVGSPVSPVADAAAATSISGAVTSNGSRVAGATVTLFRHDNGLWVRTSIKTTTNSYGRYYIGGLSNWKSYYVEGYKHVNYCAVGYFQTFRGNSQSLYATGGERGANIAIYFEGNWSCY